MKNNTPIKNKIDIENMSPAQLNSYINKIKMHSKAALLLAIVSLLLSVVLFFGLSRNLKGVIKQLKAVPTLTQQVEDIKKQLP